MNLNLKQKFYGSFYGGAIGDAMGLGTEFMSPAEVRRRYPEGLNDYSQIVQDAHRSQWERGQWTNDTEVLIAMMETIIQHGRLDPQLCAEAIYNWFLTNPVDIVPQVRWVVSQPDYLDNPSAVADRVWIKMGRQHASNEALQRSILCGVWEKDPESKVAEICRITHPDMRCICSATILAKIAHALMHDDRLLSRSEIMEIAEKIDKRVCPYIEMTDSDDISDLELADPETLWYVRKCMACAIWTLRHTDSPEEALQKVIMAGGDADTNAAVALNLVGMRDGYEKIPRHLIEGLYDRRRLDDVAGRFYPILETKLNSI